MSKPVWFLTIFLVLLMGMIGIKFSERNASATQGAVSNCILINQTTIKLSGTINKDMKLCVAELMTSKITKIIINTTGGDVDYGREIGYLIGNVPRTLIIEKYCLSSCGNYFVPAAHTVVLWPGAVIGLHGTPDPYMLSSLELETHIAKLTQAESVSSSSARRILEQKITQREYQLAEEAKFAKRFSVPLGWRLYRDANDSEESWRQYFEDGSDDGVSVSNFMIVEQPMMASCLPHVKIKNFQNTLETSVLTSSEWKTLEDKIGAYRSLGLKCRA